MCIGPGALTTTGSSYATVLGGTAYAKAYGGVALGYRSEVRVGGDRGVAVGYNTMVSGLNSTAVGHDTETVGDNASAFGFQAKAGGSYSNAIGNLDNSVARTTSIANPVICSDPATNTTGTAILRTERLTGTSAILTTEVIGFLATSNTELSLPTNFWVEEVGVVCTTLTGLTTQPTVSFGTTSGGVDILAASLTTALTAVGKRERYTSPLLADTALSGLWCAVSTIGAATTLAGRFYVKGFFMAY